MIFFLQFFLLNNFIKFIILELTESFIYFKFYFFNIFIFIFLKNSIIFSDFFWIT